MDEYRPLEYHVFVLRFWRERSSGTWRGQIVHLPEQETAAFARWDQAQTFVSGFVRDLDRSQSADDETAGAPA